MQAEATGAYLRRQERACRCKQFYATKSFAKARVRQMRLQRIPNAETLEAYLCEFCAGFHIGHRWREAS